MWNRIGMAFGLGAAAAGGFLWIARHSDPQPVAPPVVIVQTPPPPPAAYVPSLARLPEPAVTPTSPPAPVPRKESVRDPQPPPAFTVSASPKPQRPAATSVPSAPVPDPPASQPAPAGEPKVVSASSMPALPPPNLPAPSVLQGQQPRPPQAEPDEQPEKVAETAAAPRGPRSVTIPAGTMIPVRLRDTIHTGRDSKDDPVVVTLDAPLIVNGLAIAERGSLQKGRIVDLDRASRMGGRAKVAIELTQLTLSDGQTVDIATDSFVHEGEKAEKKDTLRRTATWAAIAASIGAMSAGGKGAAIGAGAGAAAGAGSVIFTKSPEAVLPSETRLTFRMKQPVTVTEKSAKPN